MSNNGKKVSVHYRGTLDDGTQFDSSYDRNQPLEFTCMAGQMIAGFDKAVETMEVGQTVNVHLEPAEAYGEWSEANLLELTYEQLGGGQDAEVGQKVYLQSMRGPMAALVHAKTDKTITFDLNHELAGKPLNFEITLLSAE